MGAFLIRYWNTRLRFLFFTRIFLLPVWLPLSAWFLRQLYYGFHLFAQNVSINFWAHIGGFTFGVLVALGFRYYRIEEEVIAKELRRQDERDWQKSEAAASAAKALARPADLVLGIEARKVGRLEEAREHLERAAKEFPFNLDVHFELQQVLQRLGRIQEANAHQGAVVGALLEMGRTEEALARYHRLLQVAPDAVAPGRSQYRLARLLEEKREWFAAAAAFRAFATREPQDELAPKALFLSGLLLLDRLQQPAQAAAMFDYLRQRYPGHPIQQHVTPVRERAMARQRKEKA
jgi:tetratricopeptide (TPR) repeat protein